MNTRWTTGLRHRMTHVGWRLQGSSEVLPVDIPVFNTSWGGLRMEDGFLVTSDGAERLDDAPYAISV